MNNQTKIFSFKINCQANNVFPNDLERTVDGYVLVQKLSLIITTVITLSGAVDT